MSRHNWVAVRVDTTGLDKRQARRARRRAAKAKQTRRGALDRAFVDIIPDFTAFSAALKRADEQFRRSIARVNRAPLKGVTIDETHRLPTYHRGHR